MPSQLPFFPWEVRYSPAGLQPVLCTGAWWAGHIRILAQGTSTQGLWEANLETWRTGEGPRWRDTGLEVSLQAEARGRQKRENEDTCFFCARVCPGTALAAAAACAIGTAWETSAGYFTLHTRASQRPTGRSTARRSSSASHSAPPLSRDAVRSHDEQDSTAVCIPTLSFAESAGCCRLVGSTGLKKKPSGNLHWVFYKPTSESQNQNSSSNCGKLVFTMLLSEAVKERDLGSI